MFENPGRGRQARNFATNVPKILDLKSSSEQIISRKLSLGAPENGKLGSFTYSHWYNDGKKMCKKRDKHAQLSVVLLI